MHRHRDLAGQVRREGGTPQKLEDSTRPLYKEREELGKRYIEMLRALLRSEQRWKGIHPQPQPQPLYRESLYREFLYRDPYSDALYSTSQ